MTLLLALPVIVTLLLALLASAVLTWRVVYRVDLGALDRSRKASRVAMIEATSMLRSGDVDPTQVATFLTAAIEATSLPHDTFMLPVAG